MECTKEVQILDLAIKGFLLLREVEEANMQCGYCWLCKVPNLIASPA